MNANERKAKLKEILDTAKPCRTGIPITYHGSIRTFDAYQIPLAYLVYNPYNGRIGSLVKSYERQSHQLNAENPADKKIIEKFLWDSRPDANKKTRERLLKEHQQKHGIVTADGIIIDGNRRAFLLNSLWEDQNIPYSEKSHCQYFIAIILPEDADKKEVMALETTYQMGEDAKVDYNPIEKYLKARDLKDLGFTDDDIADMMGIKSADVRKYQTTLKLMDEYLEENSYTGMYTQLGKSEDSFLRLETALKRFKSGGIPSMWDYDPESDVSDLKLVAFDYIRAGTAQDDFRKIIYPPSYTNSATSFFAKKEIWENFRDKHFEIVDNTPEQTVEEIMATNPPDLSRALKARDKEWVSKINSRFKDNYEQSLDMLNNYSNEAKPLQQLRKACQALYVVNTEQESFQNDSEVRDRVEELDKYVSKFKEILGM